MARWGRICATRSNESPTYRRLTLNIHLPWPERKAPVLERHMADHLIHYNAYDGEGWSQTWRTRKDGTRVCYRYPRPERRYVLTHRHALRLFDSIGWECGNRRKDIAMKWWRAWYERPRLS